MSRFSASDWWVQPPWLSCGVHCGVEPSCPQRGGTDASGSTYGHGLAQSGRLRQRNGDIRPELTVGVEWFNTHRPHQSLGGRTPLLPTRTIASASTGEGELRSAQDDSPRRRPPRPRTSTRRHADACGVDRGEDVCGRCDASSWPTLPARPRFSVSKSFENSDFTASPGIDKQRMLEAVECHWI